MTLEQQIMVVGFLLGVVFGFYLGGIVFMGYRGNPK